MGRYYNRLYESESDRFKSSNQVVSGNQMMSLAAMVVKQYSKCLSHGTKYLFETLPRLLTLWMDSATLISKLPKLAEGEKDDRHAKFQLIHKGVRKLSERLPTYLFLTVISQLVSRISHKHPSVQQVLEAIIANVLSVYPQQTAWHLMPVAKSTIQSRSKRVISIFAKIKSDPMGSHSRASLVIQVIWFKIEFTKADGAALGSLQLHCA